eukprot:1158161-Pelagomonas_calceolata.AAC.3
MGGLHGAGHTSDAAILEWVGNVRHAGVHEMMVSRQKCMGSVNTRMLLEVLDGSDDEGLDLDEPAGGQHGAGEDQEKEDREDGVQQVEAWKEPGLGEGDGKDLDGLEL